MKTVELHGGHVLEVDETRLDNMELLDAIAELNDQENPNPLALSKTLTLLLGVKGKKALYDLYRDKEGLVRSTEISTAIAEIFNGLNAKNS